MSDSSDLFKQAGRGPGVRRLNRVPLVIAGLMLMLIIGAVMYTIQTRVDPLQNGGVNANNVVEPVTPDSVPAVPVRPVLPPPVVQAPPVEPAVGTPERPDVQVRREDPYEKDWERYQQELERMRQARNQGMLQAIRSKTAISGHGTRNRGAGDGEDEDMGGAKNSLAGLTQLSGQYSSLAAQTAARAERLAANGGVSGDYDGGGGGYGGGSYGRSRARDINRAAEKRSFLNERGQQDRNANTLQGGREAPLSPYEVKAGTIIPAVMIGGINSDLPGQILGQISQNVYDSATGRFILIPQGSKLIGNYDNSTTPGQERILVVWNRIIYPDGSSVDLGSMPGVDAAGFAGLHDKVNTHFWKAFGNALMLSLLSAGVQLSQGVNNSGNGNDATQTIAAGIGQQMTQLGQNLLERDSQIQPTLEIRQGYNFNVMVTKDMILRPWVGDHVIGSR